MNFIDVLTMTEELQSETAPASAEGYTPLALQSVVSDLCEASGAKFPHWYSV